MEGSYYTISDMSVAKYKLDPPNMETERIPASRNNFLTMSIIMQIGAESNWDLGWDGLDNMFVIGLLQDTDMMSPLPKAVAWHTTKGKVPDVDNSGSIFFQKGWYNAGEPEMFRAILELFQNARQGDKEAASRITEIYKVNWKKEYGILKKFKTLEASDIVELVTDVTRIDPPGVARIYGICIILGIETNIKPAKAYLNQFYKKYTNDHATRIFTGNELGFEGWEDAKAKAVEESQTYLDDDAKTPKHSAYRKASRLMAACCVKEGCCPVPMYPYLLGVKSPEKYDEESRGRYADEYIETLAILKTVYPGKAHTPEEVQAYMPMLQMAKENARLTRQSEEYDDAIRAEKQAAASTQDEHAPEFQPKTTENTNKDTNEDTAREDETERLRNKIKDLEAEKKNLKALYSGLKEEYRKLAEKIPDEYLDQNPVLVQEEPEESADTEAEDEEQDNENILLPEAGITIIGGHARIVQKTKKLHPKWKYVDTDNKTSLRMTDDMQYKMIFFFTEHISHSAYNKFAEYAKDKKIPYGHLKGNNVDKVEAQLKKQYSEAIAKRNNQ